MSKETTHELALALRAWMRLDAKERESLIDYLEEEAEQAKEICSKGDPFAKRWERENRVAARLLRAITANASRGDTL